MAFTYHIDKSKNLIVGKYVGAITVVEQLTCIRKIMADSAFRRGMNSLSDLTEAEYDWGLKEIDEFRSFVYSIADEAGPCKWALLCRGGVTLAAAKLFILLHDMHCEKITVKLFSSRFDAIKWLEGAD